MNEFQIRPVAAMDLDGLIQLCADHANHEGTAYSADGKESALFELFFSETPRLHCLVVETNQKLVGYASYTIQYSTWRATRYLYLDSLYLARNCRGMGLGKQLMNRVRTFANEHGCDEVQWQTPTDNRLAIGFYDSIEGTRRSNKVRYRFAIDQFALTSMGGR